eukprot:4940989-Amphidinium_carterae.2
MVSPFMMEVLNIGRNTKNGLWTCIMDERGTRTVRKQQPFTYVLDLLTVDTEGKSTENGVRLLLKTLSVTVQKEAPLRAFELFDRVFYHKSAMRERQVNPCTRTCREGNGTLIASSYLALRPRCHQRFNRISLV